MIFNVRVWTHPVKIQSDGGKSKNSAWTNVGSNNFKETLSQAVSLDVNAFRPRPIF